MLIRCPECQFEREINTDKIPVSASMATCPRCGERFRFRDPQSGDFIRFEPRSAPLQPGRLPTEQDGDDPLPPGAIIPTLEEPIAEVKTASNIDPKTEDKNQSQKTVSGYTISKIKPGAGLDAILKKLGSLFPPKAKTGSGPMPLFPPKQEEEEEEEGSPLAWREDWSKGVPWENPDDYGLFSGLYHTLLDALFRTRIFFIHVWSTQPLTMAAIFFVLLTYFAFIVTKLWSMLPVQGISPTLDMGFPEATGLGTPLFLIILPFLLLAAMFIQAGLYHLMIRLVQPEEADFPTTARVIAYSSAPFVLCLVPFIGFWIGLFWFITLSFIGCKYAHDLSWSRAALALAPLFLLEFAIVSQLL